MRFLVGRFDTRSGYVGAYRDGFQPPALLRAAEQLHELLPRILDRHTLKYHWAHVFDPAQVLQSICPEPVLVNTNCLSRACLGKYILFVPSLYVFPPPPPRRTQWASTRTWTRRQSTLTSGSRTTTRRSTLIGTAFR
eukprot:COSAG06_NODE_711_length_12877_cov_16.318281_3_plen_137_part_00